MITLTKKIISFIIAMIALVSPLQRYDIGTPTVTAENLNVFMCEYPNTKIAAHRSGMGVAPENTLSAIKECVKADDYTVDMLELDLQITKDGELVLFHDLVLDEDSNSEEYFGRSNVAIFTKTYDELRCLNLGENFHRGEIYPYRGLRGDDIPNDVRILKLEDMFDYLESQGKLNDFIYSLEIKYPFPWAPKMLKEVYGMIEERDLTDRVIIGSFWPDVISYFDKHYDGKLNRYASITECLTFYRDYHSNEDISKKDIKFTAMSLPYYEDNGKMVIANVGDSSVIDYAHKYGIAMHFWTINDPIDIKALSDAGADLLMSDYPQRAYDIVYGD